LYNAGNGQEITKYYNDTFAIWKITSDTDPNLTVFSAFSATAGAGNQGSFRYQLSIDGNTWQYWNGSAWSNVSGVTD